jgi:hypothetical protein
VSIWVSVVDNRDASSISQNSLTEAFASIGVAPSFEISNGTHRFQFSSTSFTVS